MSVHFGYADVLYSSLAQAGRFIGAGMAAALNLRCLTFELTGILRHTGVGRE